MRNQDWSTSVADAGLHNCWERFDEHGELRNPDDANQAAAVMLDQLVWWGRVLRDARTKDRERDAAA